MDEHETYRIDHHVRPVADDLYFVPVRASHRPAAKRILRGEIYEPLTHRLFESVLVENPGSAVHAGAFFGDMLPHLSRIVDGSVWAFEPVLESYVLAQLCCEANGLTNVRLHRAALTDAFGTLRMSTEDRKGVHRGGASRVDEAGRQTVPGMTLDSLPLESLLIVHLDVEGHELQALQGARSTLAHHRPVVAIEDNPQTCASFLEAAGYIAMGAIPGVQVWAHPGNRDLLLRVREFFADIADQRRPPP